MKIFGWITLFITLLPLHAFAQQAVSIGYFNEWPLPALFGKQNSTFRESLGAPVNWRAFDSASDLSLALESDQIQIGLSQGIVPILAAVNAGHDIQIIDIAAAYGAIENCVVRARLNITKENAHELEGLTVAVPMGTTVHFSLVQQLRHLGLEPKKLHLLDLPPSRAAAALAQGQVDVACGWGIALEQMKERGNILLTSDELFEIGIMAFDSVIVKKFYGTANAENVTNILNTNDKLNFAYSDDRTEMLTSIAAAASLTEAASLATLDTFTFPDIDQKRGDRWLGGGVQTYLKSLADFLVEQGTFSTSRDSYDAYVNAEYLGAVQEIQLNETTNDPTILAPQQQD